MVVKVSTAGLQWSQPIVPHSPSSSQTLACAVSSRSSSASSSSRRRSRGGEDAVMCRNVQRLQRSALFGTTPSPARLNQSLSCDFPKLKFRTVRRSCSASLESFSDEEFSKKLQELALRFQLSDDDAGVKSEPASEDAPESSEENQEFLSEPPGWTPAEEIIPASVERRANSVELPVSLRMIKRKMQWEESLMEAGESAYCSVKKAFSSMVFIIRELHSYTLQMREILFYEDLQGVLSRVQKEIHASFVWLFQQVFSHTPTLMVHVMILLANFTVYSMGHNAAIAAVTNPSPPTALTETVSAHETSESPKFDSSAVKTFSLSSSGGKSTSVGGGSGGGGTARPVASGTDGDSFGAAAAEGLAGAAETETEKDLEAMSEEEVALWNSVVGEALEMEASVRHEALDRETVERFVAPVSVQIESDAGYPEYIRTELIYQKGLADQPGNVLLLANYAQFLYLVIHDYDRAEYYFKRATAADPPDAEAFNKYAKFLWCARNDLAAAEEAYAEAVGIEPDNPSYMGAYAYYLWSTGDEEHETCFTSCPPISLDNGLKFNHDDADQNPFAQDS